MSLKLLARFSPKLVVASSSTAAPTIPRQFSSTISSSDSESSSPPSKSLSKFPPTSSTATTPLAERRSDLNSSSLRYLKTITDLNAFDPVLDLHPFKTTTPPLSRSQKFPTTIVRMGDSLEAPEYSQPYPAAELIDNLPGEDDSIAHLSSVTDLSPGEIRGLFRFPLVVKRVVTMKSKGKMPSMYSLVVVGNGKGLVGVGEGKDETANKAVSKAFNQAVRSMDYVERYDERTVWGTMENNFGSCKIQMRSRPPGFGLRVNHYIHQVAKAAGISDLSAKVHGSRNGTRVIKLAVSMLHGGSVPLDMGDAFGHKGQRRNKKVVGMQLPEELGKARGRKAIVV